MTDAEVKAHVAQVDDELKEEFDAYSAARFAGNKDARARHLERVQVISSELLQWEAAMA